MGIARERMKEREGTRVYVLMTEEKGLSGLLGFVCVSGCLVVGFGIILGLVLGFWVGLGLLE